MATYELVATSLVADFSSFTITFTDADNDQLLNFNEILAFSGATAGGITANTVFGVADIASFTDGPFGLLGGAFWAFNSFDVTPAFYTYQLVPTSVSNVSYVGTNELQLDLSSIFNVGGDVTISGNDQLVSIDLSNLLSVGGNFTLSNNGALLTITLPSLATAGGDIDISGDSSATSVNLGSLASAGGNVDISGDTSATSVNLGSLTSAGGNIDISGDTSATSVNLGSLTSAGGNVDISGDTSATSVNLGSLTSAGGNVDISDDSAATSVNLGSLTSAGGNIDISGDTSATSVNLGSLTSAGGSVSLIGNTAAITIDLGALIQAGALMVSQNGVVTLNLSALVQEGGDVAITNNTHLLTVDLPHLSAVGGDLALSGDSSATEINLGSLSTVGGDVTVSGDSSAAAINLGSLSTTSGDVTVSSDTSATTINLGSLDTTGGDVTINTAADAKLDASALGPGGGKLMLIGDNLTTTVTLGSLAHMQGTLTVTSADGVTVTAQAGLGELAITGTADDNTLIGSATANNDFDAKGGNDTMTGGAGDDTYLFDVGVAQHTQVQDILTTVHHHDFVDLSGVTLLTIGGVAYDRPAPTASITAWKNWDNALTTYANMQADNTGGDHFVPFTNSNPASGHGAAQTVGTIQLADGYYHDYDTTTLQHETVTFQDLSGDGFDTITNFSHIGLPGSNGGAGNDVLVFRGLSSDSAAPNYWGNSLDSTAANGNTTIHIHDIANHGADAAAITLTGVTSDVPTLVQNGAIQFV